MKRQTGWALAFSAAMVTPTLAQQYVYPAKGQSAQQQKSDEAACYQWAVQQSGFDPAKPPPPRPVAAAPTTATGTTPGAAVGAAAARGQSRRQNAAMGQQAQQQQQQQQQAATQQQQAGFSKARSAGLEGKGYTVK